MKHAIHENDDCQKLFPHAWNVWLFIYIKVWPEFRATLFIFVYYTDITLSIQTNLVSLEGH